MQWSKVKTILIVLLLAVNVFLLANIVKHRQQEYKAQQELAGQVEKLLLRRGITSGDALLGRTSPALPVCVTERRRTDEESFARALLSGSLSENEIEDGLQMKGENGQVLWKLDGSLEGRIKRPPDERPETPGEAERYARVLLADAGAELTGALVTAEETESGFTVKLSYLAKGAPVWDYALTLAFYADDTVGITGKWIFGAVHELAGEGRRDYSPEDAVLAFTGQPEAEKVTHIDSCAPVYYASELGGGRLQLDPAWQIQTDLGIFCVDARKNTILEVP